MHACTCFFAAAAAAATVEHASCGGVAAAVENHSIQTPRSQGRNPFGRDCFTLLFFFFFFFFPVVVLWRWTGGQWKF
ncbi:hypothetical protein IWX46DRAFT_591314 [Phyllosticta citricarpa]|uniref:Secreted protein n=1 Tax=Phyllosticta citricarpa TaxID=55181 RepID=A0ABR1MKW1_9PEZI